MSHPILSTGLYLAMGWLAVVAAKPLLAHVATGGLVLLAALLVRERGVTRRGTVTFEGT